MEYKQGQIVSPYDLFHTLDNSCQVLSHLSHFSFDIIPNSVEIEPDDVCFGGWIKHNNNEKNNIRISLILFKLGMH